MGIVGNKNKIRVSITADLKGLTREELSVLKELKKTAGFVDTLYLKQCPKAEKTNFYPNGFTKEKFEKYLKKYPKEKDGLSSHFTIVRERGGRLLPIPYSEYYKNDLKKIISILTKVEEKTTDKKFKKFLQTKIAGFLNNDFSKSDLLWINLKPSIELTIGPYEEYEDTTWGAKRSFELTIGINLREENIKLVKYQKWASDYDKFLGKKYKYKANGAVRTMLIIDEVCAGGGSRIAYIPMAYNLPNDTWIRQKYGSKQVFMRNVMHAKFNNLTRKIAEVVVGKEVSNLFTADDYILGIIGHELAHGFGVYCKNGLRELGHSLEEAKADVYGITFLYWLADKGLIPKKTANASALAKTVDGLRQLRFGQKEAHAMGALIQYNWLIKCGAIKVVNDKLVIDEVKLRAGQESLSDEFAKLAFAEDYKKAKSFITKWVKEIKAFEPLIKKISKLPVDIIPVFE